MKSWYEEKVELNALREQQDLQFEKEVRMISGFLFLLAMVALTFTLGVAVCGCDTTNQGKGALHSGEVRFPAIKLIEEGTN